MMKKWMMLMSAFPLNGLALDSMHCLKGCPEGSSQSNTVIQRPIYVLNHNRTTKLADWVAYKVEETNFGPTRRRSYTNDPDLDASRYLKKTDYTGANAALGYEKGHLAPLASFAGSTHWKMTNHYSNITPQHKNLNGGPWKHLEAAIRDYARTWQIPVYVVSGTLYDSPMTGLPNSSKSHQVPSGFYKVIATIEDGQVWATGFEFHQVKTDYTNYCDYWKSVDDIEQRTGLNFLPHLSGATENDVEAGAWDLWYYLGCWEF